MFASWSFNWFLPFKFRYFWQISLDHGCVPSLNLWIGLCHLCPLTPPYTWKNIWAPQQVTISTDGSTVTKHRMLNAPKGQGKSRVLGAQIVFSLHIRHREVLVQNLNRPVNADFFQQGQMKHTVGNLKTTIPRWSVIVAWKNGKRKRKATIIWKEWLLKNNTAKLSGWSW